MASWIVYRCFQQKLAFGIRPTGVRPLTYPERVQKAWGFFHIVMAGAILRIYRSRGEMLQTKMGQIGGDAHTSDCGFH